jgi:hypothetical protein
LALIVCGAPIPGKQFVETALWDVCDLRENIGEPGLGITGAIPFLTGGRKAHGVCVFGIPKMS